ncbi:MAG: glycosyl transferase [Clostridia bacterium]|nr:glycosyl transferase [Clostridia bacterium]
MNLKHLLDVVFRYLTSSDYRFLIDANVFHRYDAVSDIKYLTRKYKVHTGRELDLSSPQRFNEKLQWLKIHDRNPIYTTFVDKYLVKDYVASVLGGEYIIPTLGVWDDPEEIDFSSLPNQFVLKCNHNSGLGMCICKDKSKLDIAKVKKELRKGLNQNYYLTGREWPYKDVPRKILAEAFLSDGSLDLIDYKVHNFNGEAKCILVCKDRFQPSGLTEDFFTPAWTHMNVRRPKHPCSTRPIDKPNQLNEILDLSAKLSKDIPFLRTDFYIVNGRVYFSELTLFPASGFELYEPDQWDCVFGSWLRLPQ